MENNHDPSFEEIVNAARERAARDMANAVPSDELPSDDIRRDHPGSRLSEAARAGGNNIVAGEVQVEPTKQEDSEEPVPMPEDIKKKFENLRHKPKEDSAPLSEAQIAEFNRARAKASSRTPQHPPESRY